MPESCSADSTAPRPPAAKRLKHSECSCVRCGVGANADFSNFKPLEDAKVRIIQCSIGCNPCEAFAAAKGTSVTELVAADKDKPTKAKMEAALADRERFSADGLAAVFTGLGYEMSRSPVERHRRGQCQCPAAS